MSLSWHTPLPDNQKEQELFFYDETINLRHFGIFWSNPTRIAITNHAVIYETKEKSMTFPIAHVSFYEANKNSSAYVSCGGERFYVSSQFLWFENIIRRVLKTLHEKNQSLETLFEVLEYEKTKRNKEQILTIWIARDHMSEFIYFIFGSIFLLSVLDYWTYWFLIGLIALVLFFVPFGIRTYYIVRESAIVEHYFIKWNIKNTFLLKNIIKVEEKKRTVILFFANGSERYIKNVQNAKVFIEHIQARIQQISKAQSFLWSWNEAASVWYSPWTFANTPPSPWNTLWKWSTLDTLSDQPPQPYSP